MEPASQQGWLAGQPRARSRHRSSCRVNPVELVWQPAATPLPVIAMGPTLCPALPCPVGLQEVWGAGCVTLIGDAAHGMLPTLG